MICGKSPEEQMEDNFGYVYRTFVPKYGAFYIGQKSGKFDPKYFGSGRIISSFIKKHGIDSLILDVLYYAKSQKELDDQEEWHIKTYRNFGFRLFNLKDFAWGNKKGTRRPAWIGKKISKSKKGISTTIRTRELNEKIRTSLLGKRRNPEFKEKMREIALNRGPVSKESRTAMRNARLGKKFSPLSEEHKLKISISNKITWQKNHRFVQ